MYFGVLATALSVIALGLTAVVKASAGQSEGKASAREKTLLELQVESSREIRRALATPVSHPPRLPPITARPARDLRESAAAAQETGANETVAGGDERDGNGPKRDIFVGAILVA